MKKLLYILILLCAALILAGLIGCAGKPNDEIKNIADEIGLIKYIKHDIDLRPYGSGDDITPYGVALELPEDFAIKIVYEPDGTKRMYDKYYSSNGTILKILKNDEIIGIITLDMFGYTLNEDNLENYKNNPSQSLNILFYRSDMLVSVNEMISWGTDYKIVYASDDWRESNATSLICFRSDLMSNNSITDFTGFKEETREGDSYKYYYNKGIMGYNLNLEEPAYLTIEFYYDSVTDEALEHIAESLRISGEEKYQNPIWDEFDFNILSYHGEYDGAPVGGPYSRHKPEEININNIIRDIFDGDAGYFRFDTDSAWEVSFKFVFNPNKIPAEIGDIFYVAGSSKYEEKHYVTYPIKMPAEYGDYIFFVNLKWSDGTEEVVTFGAEVTETVPRR